MDPYYILVRGQMIHAHASRSDGFLHDTCVNSMFMFTMDFGDELLSTHEGWCRVLAVKRGERLSYLIFLAFCELHI